jgi:small subunit ribosomal protein S16
LLKIRLTKTGKKSQPSYRIVVAEHTAPIKSKFVEIIGNYNVSRNPRELTVDQDRVKYWMSVGAQPSDSVAVLLKGLGMEGMDKYIGARDLKRKKKKASEEEEKSGGSAEVTEAPAEEKAEEVPVEEAKEEEKVEEAPVEEVKAEETKEEPAKEEAPAEEASADDSPETPASEDSDEKSEEAS